MANATEVAYNLSLARLLRHEGLSAEGEQRRVFGGSRGQADVLLDFDELESKRIERVYGYCERSGPGGVERPPLP